MNKKLKKALIITGSILGGVVLILCGYVGFILLSYNRIGDIDLSVDEKSSLEQIEVGNSYKAMSYNIGFGAYSQDYTFFFDTGYDENGNKTVGHYSKARNKKEVEFNTEGAINTTKEQDADFIFFQEVDTNSTRSRHINQDKKIVETYSNYDHVYAKNFHTAFLPYPLYDMHGIVNSGLSTMSRYKIQSAGRKQYTVSNDFSKYFDLDRCFSYSTIKVNNGKTLYLINSHMSAYDEGGVIRKQQVKELNDFLADKTEDYVVIGGDWNHDLLINNPDFTYNSTDNRPFNMTLKAPDWLSYYFDDDLKSPLIDGYHVVASDNVPTCRNNDIEWDPDATFRCVVDGFIVSNNINIIEHKNIQTKNGKKGLDGFAFSDHDPAYIEFSLL